MPRNGSIPTRLALLLFIALLPASPWDSRLLAAEDPPPAAPDSTQGAPASGMTLEAWRELSIQADEAIQTPEPADRIAQCELFLRDHPDYPETAPLLEALLAAHVETGQATPDRMMRLIERRAALEDDSAIEAARWIGLYAGKVALPAGRARRVLQLAQEQVSRLSRSLAREREPARREEREEDIGRQQIDVAVANGRFFLSQGDAPAALRVLKEAEGVAGRQGLDILVSGARGKEPLSLPCGRFEFDPLLLLIAEAYEKSGNAGMARQYLEKVRAFLFEDEYEDLRRDLESKLNVSPLPAVTVTADPQLAPELSLNDLSGKRFALSSYRGKVVLLYFWALT